MARLLAIEWDNTEARVVVATARGESISIDEAFAIPLPPRGEQDSGDADRGAVIGAALAARRLGRVQCLAAVGRASIELKQLSLPPSPDDELPDLVRFQALRDFHSLDEDWPLDFIPLTPEADKPRQVLAAAISTELVAQIRETTRKAGLEPERLVLRPCAAASLLRRVEIREPEHVRLLVDVLADEADLTVLVDGQVVFLRTARLPGDALAPDAHRPLVSEIRRTIAAARNQLGGRKVDAIHLCGSGADHAALAAQIERDIDLPCRVFDPFTGLSLSRELKTSPPDRTGRFTPLVGMLLDESQQAAPAIDFLNPRRRPPPPDHRRKLALVAAAVGALVLLGAGWFWSQLSGLDDEIATLAQDSKDKDKLVAKAKEFELAAKEIDAWRAGDINWLDELRELSGDFPVAKDVLITQLRMGPHNAGGEIALEGYLREAANADAFEASLRDESHRVEGRGLQQDSSKPGYGWHFTTALVVSPQDAEAYRKHDAARPPRPVEEEETAAQNFGGPFGGGFGGPGGGGFGGRRRGFGGQGFGGPGGFGGGFGGPGDFGEPGMGPGSGADKAAPSSDSGDKPSDSGDKPKAGGQDAAGAKAPAAEKGESASKSEGPQG